MRYIFVIRHIHGVTALEPISITLICAPHAGSWLARILNRVDLSDGVFATLPVGDFLGAAEDRRRFDRLRRVPKRVAILPKLNLGSCVLFQYDDLENAA